ncbi:MAG: sugar porter family MFS transporter [Bacteroidales bacterium]|nr:sugar porter family MFS transporter [Bacteroidales bacterium]
MDKKKLYIIKVSLIVALGGFLMGFDASVISGVVKFIEPHFDLSKIQLGWAVSCLTLTATLAMAVAGPLSDRYGRKKLLYFAAILYGFSALASALAPSFLVLVLARMLGGLGVGLSLIIAPMYIAELAPAKNRGTMVSFNQLNIVLGISIAFFTNYLILKAGNSNGSLATLLNISENNWRWMLGIESVPAILYFLFLFIVPESPRWLIMKGRDKEALEILSNTTDADSASKDLDKIKASFKKANPNKKVSVSELFSPTLRLVLLIGIVVAITQQITGINAVFFYAPMIFEQTGIGLDASFSQAILVGLTNLVFTLLAMWLIDRIGRKILLIIGLSGIIISMSLLSIAFGSSTYYIDESKDQQLQEIDNTVNWSDLTNISYDSDLKFKNALAQVAGEEILKENESALIGLAININTWLVLVGIIGFVASFAISLGPVMWVLFSELFPNRVRGLAISLAGFINSGISFIVQLVFPWELANLGNTGTFIIYGAFGLVGLIFIIRYLPETKGKSLEELEEKLVV